MFHINCVLYHFLIYHHHHRIGDDLGDVRLDTIEATLPGTHNMGADLSNHVSILTLPRKLIEKTSQYVQCRFGFDQVFLPFCSLLMVINPVQERLAGTQRCCLYTNPTFEIKI